MVVRLLRFPLFLPPPDVHASVLPGVENAAIKTAMTERSGKGKQKEKTRSNEVVSFLSSGMFQPSTLVILVRMAEEATHASSEGLD